MTDEKARRRGNERDDDQFAVRANVTRGQADELLRRSGLDFGDHPNISENPDGTGSLDLFVSRTEIAALQAEGYQIEVGANLSARARERLTEVGQGDRFEGGRIPPRGLGRKIGGRSGGPPSDGSKGDDRPERGS
jgi:hypothetical protein